MEAPADAEEWDVAVIGAGAAGLLAGARSAERGFRTVLLEKNTKAGVKILMSGGTRCNITHATDAAGIMEAFGRSGRFLRTALQSLGPSDVVEFFAAEGVPTKVEETGKIFPESDRALDVQRALLRRLSRSGAELRLSTPVLGVERYGAGFLVQTHSGRVQARRVIVSSGGRSYPGCGTTGDGYAWLESLGHTIVQPRPALVPLVSPTRWVHELSGVTLPDVDARIVPHSSLECADLVERVARCRKSARSSRRGSLLLTHFGLSGPAALDLSRYVTDLQDPSAVTFTCDLCANESCEQVEEHLARMSREHGARSVARSLPSVIPHRLAEVLVEQAGLTPETRGAELSRSARRQLAGLIKCLPIDLSGSRGFPKAEVTAGGVALAEIDARSLQSKIVPGLYVIGEILDLDGWVGGYNFQSAFSTGWLAAESLA